MFDSPIKPDDVKKAFQDNAAASRRAVEKIASSTPIVPSKAPVKQDAGQKPSEVRKVSVEE